MIRTILVDDEKLALDLMEKKLNKIGDIEIVGKFSNPELVIQEMKTLDFQVAFLDIEMTGISGLDLAEIIQEWKSDIQIVFVTAYRDYAIQAFELNSIDYLLKPVLESRLLKTINRVQEKLELNKEKITVQTSIEPSALELLCFNEFIVYNNKQPVKWKTAKVKELFAFFITHIGTYINRDSIINQLWPDYDYKKAKIQLHTCISHLRKTLDSLGYEQALTYSNQSYSLNLTNFYCDALELEHAFRIHTNINKENITLLEDTIQTYVGEYMETNEYEWANAKAQALSQQLFHILQKVIDYYTKYGLQNKKQQYLQMLLKYNPYSESTLQQLMLHYIEIGNRGDAVKAYIEFAELLQQDLDIEPDKTTKKLYQSICEGNL
ncbi:response regulator [Bacillus massiliigorillae]|uniref:response regulator n=1 Tax=Bacillus massiliigorillae TaxID=1243664 RepID=UPI0003A6CD37|nr:response regulator [Bacillus massiliigorillae]